MKTENTNTPSKKYTKAQYVTYCALFCALGALLPQAFHAMESFRKGTVLRSFCFCKKNQKAVARTCKKLPVASFCASETAETGRIANGCEQGDHVSRSRLRPATSVQIAGRNGVLDRMTSFR